MQEGRVTTAVEIIVEAGQATVEMEGWVFNYFYPDFIL